MIVEVSHILNNFVCCHIGRSIHLPDTPHLYEPSLSTALLLILFLSTRNQACWCHSTERQFTTLNLQYSFAQSLSLVWLFATPWTVACQAPLSMEFLSQESWSGLSFPSPTVFFYSWAISWMYESLKDYIDPGSIPRWGRSPGEGIGYPLQFSWAFLVAQVVQNLPAMQESWLWSLGWEGPMEKGMATHSSILAWRIPMDRGAWWATVRGVTKSQTGQSDQAQHIIYIQCSCGS